MLSPPAFSFPTKVLLLAEMNRKIKSMKEREIVMITIQGLYNTAVCYTPELEEAARKQIQTVCDQAEFAGCKIRIMPDVHAGKGCTIGTTMTIQDKIVPGMVGVDIGCGMETVELREREVDFEKLDALIRREIPYGREVRDIPHALNAEIDLTHLRCTDQVNLNRAMRSIGSLGGGNHFIEVDRAEDGRLFLVVHSGSRHLGTEVAEHYQNEGRRALWGGAQHQVQAAIDQLKAEGRFQEIQKTIKALKKEHELNIPKDLAYVEGKLFEDYIHDMKLTQQFAMLNRKAMVDVIMTGMGFTAVETFTTIHNYIDTDAMILRKGSVSAKAGEKLLIPINMRDGTKMLCAQGAAGVLRDFADVLAVPIPELTPMFGFPQHNPHHDKDVWDHTIAVIESITPEPVLRWAALLHDIGKPSCFSLAEDGIGHFFGHSDQSTSMAESILSRLRFDNASKEQIVRLVRYHDMPITADRKPIKRLLSKHGEDATRQLIELHKADTLGQSAICRHRIAIFEEVSQMINEILQEESCFTLKNLAVNGHDMMTLGFQGPTIGRVLQECLDAVLDEQIPNEHEALMAFAKDRQLKS